MKNGTWKTWDCKKNSISLALIQNLDAVFDYLLVTLFEYFGYFANYPSVPLVTSLGLIKAILETSAPY